jgi:signal transduction histidine kinase
MRLMDTHKGPDNLYSQGFWPALDWTSGVWLNLVDSLACPILVFQPDGLVLLSNKRAGQLLNLSGLEGQALPESLSPLMKGASYLEMYQKGQEVVVKSASGHSLISFSLSILPMSGGLIVATGQERAARFGLEPPVKADIMGECVALAENVSQTVKGPLTGIELYASILGEELSQSGEAQLTGFIEEIRRNVRELNEYLTSFESMTKPLNLDLQIWSLSDLVDEALLAMNGLFKGQGIGVLVDQRQPIEVEADRGLLVQLFLNLFLNSAEAMPTGGRLTVNFNLGRSGQAEVVITDTGPGVALADMKKVFNPFYTTKGQPLGLGLPVSLRIAEAHQGRLVVGSDDVLGARALLVLPSMPAVSGPNRQQSLN